MGVEWEWNGSGMDEEMEGSRNGRRRGDQTTDQNVIESCQAMGKRRKIKKGKRAKVEHEPDYKGCG